MVLITEALIKDVVILMDKPKSALDLKINLDLEKYW
jgi:ABC-type sugar transport system ATPase subunit